MLGCDQSQQAWTPLNPKADLGPRHARITFGQRYAPTSQTLPHPCAVAAKLIVNAIWKTPAHAAKLLNQRLSRLPNHASPLHFPKKSALAALPRSQNPQLADQSCVLVAHTHIQQSGFAFLHRGL